MWNQARRVKDSYEFLEQRDPPFAAPILHRLELSLIPQWEHSVDNASKDDRDAECPLPLEGDNVRGKTRLGDPMKHDRSVERN